MNDSVNKIKQICFVKNEKSLNDDYKITQILDAEDDKSKL